MEEKLAQKLYSFPAKFLTVPSDDLAMQLLNSLWINKPNRSDPDLKSVFNFLFRGRAQTNFQSQLFVTFDHEDEVYAEQIFFDNSKFWIQFPEAWRVHTSPLIPFLSQCLIIFSHLSFPFLSVARDYKQANMAYDGAQVHFFDFGLVVSIGDLFVPERVGTLGTVPRTIHTNEVLYTCTCSQTSTL